MLVNEAGSESILDGGVPSRSRHAEKIRPSLFNKEHVRSSQVSVPQ